MFCLIKCPHPPPVEPKDPNTASKAGGRGVSPKIHKELMVPLALVMGPLLTLTRSQTLMLLWMTIVLMIK